MDREYTSSVPDKLIEQIQAAAADGRFRRRAVLTQGNAGWGLVCCTIERFLPGETAPEPVPSRRYRQAVLLEDFLSATECLNLVQELQEGRARLGDIEIPRGSNAHWTAELMSTGNDYMGRAGYVFGAQIAQSAGRASVRTLLSADLPYYPDGDDATRDWLPLRVYHGHSDARNDHILFLLPQTRAFIADAAFTDGGTLDITIAGTDAHALPLLIKGAYWEGKALHHVEASVEDGKARLIVPEDTDRLDYYLIDRDANVYDFHREDRFSRPTQGRWTPGSEQRALEDQVREACRSGEGLHIEFKPFINLGAKRSRKEDVGKRSKQNPKLREVIETVAAFTNAEGGHIYFGVNPDCTISGISEPLREWAGAELGEASIERYFGALKSEIKDLVHGEVMLDVSHVEINGMLVGIIGVPPATHGPVAVHQEYHLYVRSGASNRKAPPDQWKSVLQPSSPPESY